MNTSISIQLSPGQIEQLRQGGSINISINCGLPDEPDEAQPAMPDTAPGKGETPPERTGRNREQEETDGEAMLLQFFRRQIMRLRNNGNVRTSETYRSAYNKLQQFTQGSDVALTWVDGEMMEALQAFLRGQGLSMNSISFYIRIVRAVYNRAVGQGLCDDRQPFQHCFTGSQTTAKRALTLDEVRRIKQVRPTDEDEEFARDLFLLSFYTRGMSFVDLAYLRKDAIHDGTLTYIRRKTGHTLTMRWEAEMQRIADRHPSNTCYLLPIIRTAGPHERSQYRTVQNRVNRHLKLVAGKAGIRQTLTMYCARHSWATIAREQKMPVSVISHAMGHTNERTTEVYLKGVDSAVIDRCNSAIISLLG